MLLRCKRRLTSTRCGGHKILLLGFFCVCVPLISGCYLSKLAYKHNNLFNSRRLITNVMNDVDVSDETKERLRFVSEVIEFAKTQGLNTEGAYRYYIETKSDSVSYIVQASFPDRLENKTWWYPFVGSVPYKGFHDRVDRDQEQASLIKSGFDTFAGRVSAFSSLGWFEDPIYSSMLNRDQLRLAALLFHELAHRSFWLEGEAKFNENLATFVENHLVESFFSHDKAKSNLDRYRLAQNDDKIYRQWLGKLKSSLREFYKSEQGRLDAANFNQAKASIFKDYTVDQKPNFKVVDYIENKEWNNATVLAASLYSPDLKRFEQARQCVGLQRIGDFLSILKERSLAGVDAFATLDNLCP